MAGPEGYPATLPAEALAKPRTISVRFGSAATISASWRARSSGTTWPREQAARAHLGPDDRLLGRRSDRPQGHYPSTAATTALWK